MFYGNNGNDVSFVTFMNGKVRTFDIPPPELRSCPASHRVVLPSEGTE